MELFRWPGVPYGMWLLLALVGCPKARTATVGDELPEDLAAAAGKEPITLLEEGAATDDPGIRARALALLVTNRGPDPWGTRALADESDWVRRAGIEALGARADAESRALLEGVAADPEADPYVRGLAALRAPGPASARAMSEAWPAEDEPWRVAPLALAAVRLGDDAARPALETALSTGELPLDLEFLAELGRTGDAALAVGLTRAQERVEDELVLPVAAARLMLGDPSAEQPLRKALGDADEERRLEALDFLVGLDHPAATALLRKASASGPDLASGYAELALAARAGTDAAVFERAYAEPDRELRRMAVRFAAEAGTSAAVSRRVGKAVERVVLAGLADPDPTVRGEAARAAARLGLSASTAPLTALLADEVEPVRVEAAGALLALK